MQKIINNSTAILIALTFIAVLILCNCFVYYNFKYYYVIADLVITSGSALIVIDCFRDIFKISGNNN